jgi:hypothetical protein
MVAEKMDPVGLPDALGKPFRRTTCISWGIIPLVKKIPKEDRQIRLFAANSSLYPVEVICLVNIGDDDNFFAGLHARVMGSPPVGRKLETEALIFRYSCDNEEGSLRAVESRSANECVHLALRNPLVPQAIQRPQDAAGYQPVNCWRRNAEGQRRLGDRVGQRFRADCRRRYDIGGLGETGGFGGVHADSIAQNGESE